MNQPYKTVTEYHFEVCDELIAITEVGKDFVIVEEVRKNGQEDTHTKRPLRNDRLLNRRLIPPDPPHSK